MIGHTLGHYRIVERLGEGGMGEVYRGVDEMLDRDVAMKMLRPELAHRADVVDRFRAEALTLARLDHPNIAHLYGMVQADPHRVMVMEFVPGETLAARVEGGGRLPWREAVDVARQLLDGLDYAHGCGIVHRDVKPANLIVRADGRVKITDFGIARVLGSARATRAGFMVGTLEYMAPEQIRGEDADERADLYAAGIVLFQLLTGRVPFSATTEFEVMRQQLEMPAPSVLPAATDAPAWLDAVIQRALSKDPAVRMASAAEFRAALSEHLADEAVRPAPKATRLAAAAVAATRVTARPTRVVEGSPRATRFQGLSRHRWTMAAGLVAGVVVSAIVLFNEPDKPASVQMLPPAPPDLTSSASSGSELAPSSPLVPPRDPAPPARLTPPAPAPKPTRLDPLRPAPVNAVPFTPIGGVAVPPTEAPSPRAAAARPDAVFEKESLVVVDGKKSHQREIILRFIGDKIQMLDRKTRERISSLALGTIDSATYSRSRQPRWKTASAGVVLGGVFAAPLFFLKGTQHWLTLEGAGAPVVIRLDKDSWERVISEIELRSAIKVSMAPASAS